MIRGDKRRENGTAWELEIDGERKIEWQVDISEMNLQLGRRR